MHKILSKIPYSIIFLVSGIFNITALAQTSVTTTSSDEGLSFIFMLMFCCVFILIYAGIAYSSYWIYNDAKQNNVENGVLWAILNLVSFPIFLLVYYFAIRPKNPTTHSNNKPVNDQSTPPSTPAS